MNRLNLPEVFTRITKACNENATFTQINDLYNLAKIEFATHDEKESLIAIADRLTELKNLKTGFTNLNKKTRDKISAKIPNAN